MPTSNSLTFTVTGAAPTITSMTPNSRVAGGAAFTVTITGTSFDATAVVKWGGASLTTTYVNATTVTASVPATDIATVGAYAVTVTTTAGGTSAAVTFTVTTGSNALTFTVLAVTPALTSISPTSATAGGGGFTLTVNGSNLLSGGSVQWNGLDRTTTWVSSSQATATILSTDIAASGSATVTYQNSGASSNALQFTITPIVVAAPPATVDLPSITVRIALNAATSGMWLLGSGALGSTTALGGPYSAPAYQAIPGAQSLHITRGRQDELGTIQPGTCDIVFDNDDGSLSPDNTGSPYAPNLLPMRRLQVQASYSGQTWTLFTGFIESFTPTDLSPVAQDMAIRAVDWLGEGGARQSISPTFVAQGDAARVTALLAACNTAGAPQAIDTDVSSFVAGSLTGVNPASHLADIQTSARGLFFVAKDGTLTYHNRQHRYLASASTTSQATFGQADPTTGQYATGVFPFIALDYALDNRYLYNDIQVTPATSSGEAMQEALDQPSIDVYFESTLQVDASLLAAGQALPLAQFLLAQYKTPYGRVHALTVDGSSDPGDGSLWAQLFGREIGDRIHVSKQAPGKQGINQDYFIEGIDLTVPANREGVTVQWQLSDARSVGATPWILGSGALGVTTGLGS